MHKSTVFHSSASSQRGSVVIVPRMLNPLPSNHIHIHKSIVFQSISSSHKGSWVVPHMLSSYSPTTHLHKSIIFYNISSSKIGSAADVLRMLSPPPLTHAHAQNHNETLYYQLPERVCNYRSPHVRPLPSNHIHMHKVIVFHSIASSQRGSALDVPHMLSSYFPTIFACTKPLKNIVFSAPREGLQKMVPAC